MEDSPIKNDKPTEKIVITDCGEVTGDVEIEARRQKDEFGDGYESHPSGKHLAMDMLSTRVAFSLDMS